MTKKSFQLVIALDIVVLLLIITISKYPLLLSFLFVVGIILLLLQKSDDFKVLLFSLVFGFVMETAAVHFGVWSYSTQDFLGVPIWMFLMWGIMATSAYRVGVYLVKR